MYYFSHLDFEARNRKRAESTSKIPKTHSTENCSNSPRTFVNRAFITIVRPVPILAAPLPIPSPPPINYPRLSEPHNFLPLPLLRLLAQPSISFRVKTRRHLQPLPPSPSKDGPQGSVPPAQDRASAREEAGRGGREACESNPSLPRTCLCFFFSTWSIPFHCHDAQRSSPTSLSLAPSRGELTDLALVLAFLFSPPPSLSRRAIASPTPSLLLTVATFAGFTIRPRWALGSRDRVRCPHEGLPSRDSQRKSPSP